jgi:hypothetical protein
MKTPRIHHEHFEPAEADVQKCAYFLWKEEGSPSGRDLDIWLRARELLRHHAHAQRTRAEPRRPLSR